MNKLYEVTADYLTNADVRERFKVAYWPGLKTTAISAEQVRAFPEMVEWLTVDSAEARDLSVRFTSDGRTFTDPPTWPIVLGEVA